MPVLGPISYLGLGYCEKSDGSCLLTLILEDFCSKEDHLLLASSITVLIRWGGQH